MFEGLLEDIQQRLVYRAQKYILSDIAGYTHSPGDLAYPDKLTTLTLSLSKYQ